MSHDTKIVVLYTKKLLIYGGLFLIGIILLFLLVNGGKNKVEDDMHSIPQKNEETGDSITEKSIDIDSSNDGVIKETSASVSIYNPGTYSTSLVLGNIGFNVDVTVSDSLIENIELSNTDDNLFQLYPLLEGSFKKIADQVMATQSAENISYSVDSKYTSLLLLEAITEALTQAEIPQEN